MKTHDYTEGTKITMYLTLLQTQHIVRALNCLTPNLAIDNEKEFHKIMLKMFGDTARRLGG